MNKNKKLLSDFSKYCAKNPNQRFFQALRNWMNVNFILVSNNLEIPTFTEDLQDTFYWETKNGKDK
jgi:hypothetical protein